MKLLLRIGFDINLKLCSRCFAKVMSFTVLFGLFNAEVSERTHDKAKPIILSGILATALLLFISIINVSMHPKGLTVMIDYFLDLTLVDIFGQFVSIVFVNDHYWGCPCLFSKVSRFLRFQEI